MTKTPKPGKPAKATAARAPRKPAGGVSAPPASVQVRELKRLLAVLDTTLAKAQAARDRIAAELKRVERGMMH